MNDFDVLPGDQLEASRIFELMHHSLSQFKRYRNEGDERSLEWLRSYRIAKQDFDAIFARKRDEDQYQKLLKDAKKILKPERYQAVLQKIRKYEEQSEDWKI
jgi:hypothetical protein